MIRSEFEQSIKKLNAKWKNFASHEQLTVFWDKWKNLPQGVLAQAADNVLFKCVHCPSGERIQEEIYYLLDQHKKNNPENFEQKNNGCYFCSGYGYLFAENMQGNECSFLCYKCRGKNLDLDGKLPSWYDVQSAGYYLKSKTNRAIRATKEWREYDKKKYGPKLGGVFYVAQTALLTQSSRGIKGVSKILKISEDDVMRIYELMVDGVIDNELIFKHNNNKLPELTI